MHYTKHNDNGHTWKAMYAIDIHPGVCAGDRTMFRPAEKIDLVVRPSIPNSRVKRQKPIIAI